jgi:hypothetical protein
MGLIARFYGILELPDRKIANHAIRRELAVHVAVNFNQLCSFKVQDFANYLHMNLALIL